MKVTVDSSRCQGHGRCYEVSPEVFLADGQGYSTVLDLDWTPERVIAAERGSDSCPERAITVDATSVGSP